MINGVASVFDHMINAEASLTIAVCKENVPVYSITCIQRPLKGSNESGLL